MASGAEVVAVARTWVGTKYVHQASLKGAGCDCLGLIRGIWREVVGPEPAGERERLGNYTPFWAEETGRETLMEAADQFLVRIDEKPYKLGAPLIDGDLILLRMVQKGPAKHAAITVSPDKIIHSYAGHKVAESYLPKDWRTKIGAAYRFP
jgi:NlpC/P60 family putative phage cell wall peptidase